MIKITCIFLLAVAFGACTPKPENKVETTLPVAPVSIFPKGNVIGGANFNGTAYLQRLMTDSETFDVVVSDVIFEPKARNSWHSHPGGQILIATAGKDYYQEKGKPIQALNPGDVVAIPADVVHWHGAAPDNGFTHIAINTKVHLGATQWYAPVTDKEYNNK